MLRIISYTILAVVGLISSGCGVIQVRSEALHYHAELDKQAADTLKNCLAGEKTSMSQNLEGAPPDCFDLVVKQSPKRIGVRSGTADLRDGDRRLPPTSDDAYSYVDQFALMSLFSKMVYHRFQDEHLRSSAAACRDSAGAHPLRSLYNSNSPNGRWRLWKDGSEGCFAQGGLFMETYVYFPPGTDVQGDGFTRAVIVFRGTENGRSQRFADWSANLSAAFNIEPVQYVAAARQVDHIVEMLQAGQRSNLPIYTAGHSLGGGLAQMAAYWNKEIKAAYAFNSTPVTGWTWIHKKRRETQTLPHMNGDPTIYRVSQRREALQSLRAVSTAANSERFGRSDFDFDFRVDSTPLDASRGDKLKAPIDQHDIGLLACHMAARVVLNHGGTSGAAAFDFTGDMALKALWLHHQLPADSLGSESLCSPSVRTTVLNAICKGGLPSSVCRPAPTSISGNAEMVQTDAPIARQPQPR